MNTLFRFTRDRNDDKIETLIRSKGTLQNDPDISYGRCKALTHLDT